MKRIIFENIQNQKPEGEYSQIFILMDENTERYCLSHLDKDLVQRAQLIKIPEGEKSKNITLAIEIWEFLSKCNADRRSILLCLGGGVVGDLGGFCAGTYKRGIDYIQIPTTLLSMVDSSVGNKTGIDFLHFKNQIGLFYEPVSIWLDPIFLKTLDKRQVLNGYAEIIKHALIDPDSDLYNTIWQTAPDNLNMKEIIEKNINIKGKITDKDPFEKNIRKWLNFGHTIGHAIESSAIQNNIDLLHGEAVAFGMLVELELSVKYLNFPRSMYEEIATWINDLYGISNKIDFYNWEYIFETMKNDKKNHDNRISFSLLEAIGQCKENIFCDALDVKNAIEFVISR